MTYLYKKQKLLLGLITKLANTERLDKLTLMKTMFLIAKEKQQKFSMYAFHPYKYGPYSSKLQSDLKYLQQKGLVEVFEQSGKTKIKGLTKIGIENAVLPKTRL